MKKLFVAAILTALFSFAASVETSAQTLGNKTDCDMIFAYEYGPTGSCTVTGYNQVIVPAHTAIPAPMPFGNEIFHAKGTYTNGSCGAFYVGLPCSTYPLNDAVSCPSSTCGSYQVTYFLSGTGYIVAYY